MKAFFDPKILERLREQLAEADTEIDGLRARVAAVATHRAKLAKAIKSLEMAETTVKESLDALEG